MTKSMTAFASNETEIDGLTISCELRTVNHRYCDITIKLPESLRYTEMELRSLLTNQISRGKVECFIGYKKQTNQNRQFTFNQEAVTALLNSVQEIEQQMPAALSFSALDILAFPGIQQEPELDKQQLSTIISSLVKQTISQLLAAREREGKQLKRLIEERCEKIMLHAELASKRIPEVLIAIRNKLKDRIIELNMQPDFDRLEQELVILAQKLDVTEELDRLATHTNEVLHILKQQDPVGRRLDFLMQELNREANTLGSKSTDKELTKIAIELKVLIEQMREQVQNIE